MQRILPTFLRGRKLVIVIPLATVFCATVVIYWLVSSYVIKHAENSIQQILLSHRGFHQYIQRVMHPTFYKARENGDINKDFYAPEILSSSYVVRVIHGFFNEERKKMGHQEVYYKMAADNPRNPVNKTSDYESRLLRMFNEHRDLKEYQEVVTIDGTKQLVYAMPFLTTEPQCLKCHGRRQDAPPGLQAMYPGEGGFGDKVGNIRAVELVRVPLNQELAVSAVFAGGLSAGAFSLFGLLMFNNRLRSSVREKTEHLEHEIAERRNVEAEVTRLNQDLEARVVARTSQLEAANKELEAFCYSVSHDLRAPLRHINGFAGMLSEECSGKLSEEGQAHLKVISRASNQMGELIDDLLSFSRISRANLSMKVVDLSEMADSVITMLRETEPDRQVTVTITQGLTACGDETLLRIALQNLLGNSWKYSDGKPDAHIEVGRTVANEKDAFFVRDNGVGFNMAYKDKLFGVFQRLHGAEFEGTGIGLATVQRVITRHGGEIWGEGEEGTGAVFYFTLPEV